MAISRRRPRRRLTPAEVEACIRDVLTQTPMPTRKVAAAVGCGRDKARRALWRMERASVGRVYHDASMATYGGFAWAQLPF